jgi:protein phosphatase
VGELVRAGRLTEEEAFDHPYRSAITRVLGTELDVDVDTLTVELQPSDLYLVCSDGLTSMVRDEEIHALATTHAGNPEALAVSLLDAANGAGGDDNITVVLFEIVAGDPDLGAVRDPVAAPELALESAQPTPGASTVRRSGAGPGSRWPALLLILAIVTVAALLVLLGLTR